jgi:hypothetical protein
MRVLVFFSCVVSARATKLQLWITLFTEIGVMHMAAARAQNLWKVSCSQIIDSKVYICFRTNLFPY